MEARDHIQWRLWHQPFLLRAAFQPVDRIASKIPRLPSERNKKAFRLGACLSKPPTHIHDTPQQDPACRFMVAGDPIRGMACTIWRAPKAD